MGEHIVREIVHHVIIKPYNILIQVLCTPQVYTKSIEHPLSSDSTQLNIYMNQLTLKVIV